MPSGRLPDTRPPSRGAHAAPILFLPAEVADIASSCGKFGQKTARHSTAEK
jgi:hypothetical protein